VTLDMLEPPRRRDLGPALHARHYSDAREQILYALAYADAPAPDQGEPEGPAGDGGAGPVH
jgi:hypothetical protein